jgi:hypothetical protein
MPPKPRMKFTSAAAVPADDSTADPSAIDVDAVGSVASSDNTVTPVDTSVPTSLDPPEPFTLTVPSKTAAAIDYLADQFSKAIADLKNFKDAMVAGASSSDPKDLKSAIHEFSDRMVRILS